MAARRARPADPVREELDQLRAAVQEEERAFLRAHGARQAIVSLYDLNLLNPEGRELVRAWLSKGGFRLDHRGVSLVPPVGR